MNIKEILKNYRKNEIKLLVAYKQERVTDELKKLEEEMQSVKMAIEFLKPEYKEAITSYFFTSNSYEKLAREYGYSKTGMVNRINRAIKALDKLCQ